MSGYLLDKDPHEAQLRLTSKERLEDPATIEFLKRTGVNRGWNCLEVGGGCGSIAVWLSYRVGDEGRVTVTDTDTRQLDRLGRPNLTVLRHDLASDPIDTDVFDLIHARDVLMHIPQREQVLRTLAGAIKPGGWLLVEDSDMSTDGPDPAAPEEFKTLYTRVTGAIYTFLERNGLDLEFGARLPGLFRGLGLEPVRAEGRVRHFQGGDSEHTSSHMPAFAELAEQVIAQGNISRREYDAFLALADEPSFTWREGMTVSVTGQRSEGE